MPVEFEVGGTIDRLAKARVAKGNPLVDLNFTTTHVARLYISDGLYEKLDMASSPTPRRSPRRPSAASSTWATWAYVYTVVYRPDLIKEDITKWSDLWKPSLKGKIAMPDFDPSHIITIAALMEGGNEVTWQKGEGKLKQLKESIAAFFSTDAQSQDLMKTGQAPVQVMLSVNAYHLQEQGIAGEGRAAGGLSRASWASTRWASWRAPRSRTPRISSSTSRSPGRSRASWSRRCAPAR